MQIGKTFLKLSVVGLFLVIIFLGAVTAAATIPSAKLEKQIGQSVKEFKKEGTYPTIGLPFRKIIVDNFTNALMVNTAYSINSQQPLKSALLDTRYDSLDNHADQIHNLEMTYLKKPVQPVNYERYWHGHLIFLRPLLIFFSYEQIRIIITAILYSLFLIFSFFVYKKLGWKKVFIYFLAFLAIDFFSAASVLTFFSVFAVGLLLAIYSLTHPTKKGNRLYFYFIGGGLTSFFDLLTAPLIVWGLLISLDLHQKKINIFKLIANSFAWLYGYTFVWISKWLIVQYLYLPGAVKRAITQITDRTSHPPDANFSRIMAVKLNFFQLVGYDKTDKILVLILLIILGLIVVKYSQITKEKIREIISLVAFGTVPYFWYFIVANHSYLHVWFTYRDQLISIITFLLILERLILNKKTIPPLVSS